MKRQSESRCRQAKLDRTALDAFQVYCVMHKSESFAWMGWLYGTYEPNSGTTTVHAVYEPPQRWNKVTANFELTEDFRSKRVDVVTGMLGLRKVGWVFTHGPRREVLSAREVDFAAKCQLEYGPQFVTVSLRLAQTVKGGQMQAQAEAYQASDQAMEMRARGIIAGIEPGGAALHLAKPVIAEGSDVTSLDPAWLTVNVPLVAYKGMFATARFPPANRPDSPVLPADLREHVLAAKSSRTSPFSDWNFLLHIAE
jgi:nuclear protein localization family protein 4